MHRFITSFGFFLFIVTSLLTQSNQTILAERAENILAQSIEFNDFVGVSAGVATADEIVWTGGAGYLNRDDQKAATAAMVHRTASLAKPMTAVAILQLAEKGLLELDASVQTYLPDFPNYAKGVISIRQLLSHTSGMKAYQSKKEFNSMVEYPNLNTALAVFKDRKLKFEPGKGYQYTTYGYTVLGAILEAVTQQPYRDYMRENVWQPAGMMDTDIEVFGERVANQSSLYTHDKKGSIKEDVVDNLSIKYPGGGLVTTSTDMLRFGQAILNGKLLSPASFATMLEVPTVERGGQTPYCLGWFYAEHPELGRMIRHGGAQSGVSNYFTVYLDKRVVSVGLGNTANADGYIHQVNKQIGDLVLWPETIERPLLQAVQLSKAEMKRFTTSFDVGNGREITIKYKDGQLFSALKGWPDLPVYPSSATELFYRVLDAQCRFTFNKDGTVEQIEFIQNGESSFPKLTAKR